MRLTLPGLLLALGVCVSIGLLWIHRASSQARVSTLCVSRVVQQRTDDSPRRVIIGFADNYGPEALYPYVRSLRDVSWSIDLILFTQTVTPEQRALCTHWGVHLMLYDPAALPSAAQPLDLGYNNLRFWYVSAYMRNPCVLAAVVNHLQSFSCKSGDLYDQFFFTDIRDALVQSDPFQAVLPSSKHADEVLHVFEHTRSITIGACPYNSKWVREVYGEAMLAELKDKPIVCAGTTMGTRLAMRNYLMVQMSEQQNRKVPKNSDQAILEVGVYKGFFTKYPVHVHSNEEAAVFTFAYEFNVRLDHYYQVVNRTGHVYAYLHTYDRHEALAAIVRARYPLNSKGDL